MLTVFLGLLVVIAGLVTLVVVTLRIGLPGFETQIGKSYEKFLAFLRTSPFGFSETDLQNLIDSGTKTVQKNSGTVVSGAVAGASTLGDIGVGLLLTLFTTLFFVLDEGQRGWALLGLVPLGTGLFRWCPLYTLLGIRTCKLAGR